MITVAIYINEKKLWSVSAQRIKTAGARNHVSTYKTDEGQIIKHRQIAGAIELAKLMLDSLYDSEITKLYSVSDGQAKTHKARKKDKAEAKRRIKASYQD